MHRQIRFFAAVAVIVGCAAAARAGGPDEPIVVLDQIGSSPAFLSGGASSSQFPPGSPQEVFATVDNFVIDETLSNHMGLMRITRIEAVVAGIQSKVNFDDVLSWNVQVHSSLSNAEKTFFGDVYGKSFPTPSAMTDGYATFQGRPAEIASFDVDFIVQPGEFWFTVAMENDGTKNGTIGILHSTIGDGPCYFAVPSLGDSFPLSGPAAYRVWGAPVPAPGALIVLAAAGCTTNRRRRTD